MSWGNQQNSGGGGGGGGGNRDYGDRGGNRDYGDRGGNRDYGDRGGNRDFGNRGGKGDFGDRGGNRDFGDRGGTQWRSFTNNRRDRDREEPRMQANVVGGTSGERTGPLKCVQMDALVFMQIMKHCRQHAPHPVNGGLLGLDVEDTLQITHSFGYVTRDSADQTANAAEEDTQYQIDTLKKLREVNVDSNTVGWYQTTHLGQFFSNTIINHQYLFQTETAKRSVLLVYDSLQSAIGKPAFKALQLSPAFMKVFSEADTAGRTAMAEFSSSDMFIEIPVSITTSVYAEAFLVDWAIADPHSTTSQLGVLDVENQAFLEKNVQLLIGSLMELAEEQQNLIMYEKNQARKGDGPQKGRDRFNRKGPPRHMDTMILSQQIQNYCKAINGFASDSFGKTFLMSNKPAAVQNK